MPQIQVIYENGVLRPLGPLPKEIQEQQCLWVTIEDSNTRVVTPPSGSVTDLETVRQILAKIPGSLAEAVCADRRRD